MNNGNTRRVRKRERNGRNIWNSNDKEFPQINARHQTTDPGSRINAKKKQTKQQKFYFWACHFWNTEYQRLKRLKKKFWNKPEGKSTIPIEKQRHEL